MQRELVIAFPGEDVEARAPLLADLAPRTCEAVWSTLPVRGQARHAIYSGSEVYLILPELMRLPPENATTRVVPGDVAFGWFAAGSFYGAHEDYCEVCWFYDRDATPSTPEGPIPVSLFARLERLRRFSRSAKGCASRARRRSSSAAPDERVRAALESAQGSIGTRGPRRTTTTALRTRLPGASCLIDSH